MDLVSELSSISSYVPKAAVGIGIVFAIIVAAEAYIFIRGKRKKDSPSKNESKPKQALEVELKPLKFPDVPMSISGKGLPSRKMTMIIVGSLAIITLGGTGSLYLFDSELSLFSLGTETEDKPQSIQITTPTKSPMQQPIVEEKVPSPTASAPSQKVELIYYWVSGANWNELTESEVLELPPSQSIAIAVFTNIPHAGARFFINGRVYTSQPENKNPFGYFFITVPRSSFTSMSDISASLLQ